MLEIGSVIDGKYKILNMIGKGGMSVVYLAMNERANKQWAIKEVRKDGVQNYEVVRQNLIVETDMLKRLNHPHLPSIVDVIDKDDSFLIVMDYIEGNPLNRVLKSGGAQPQQDVIEWAKQLCDVLGYLHSRKPPIIYRDMKPSNIMLKPDGNVVLIDFGTAREFKSSSVADTTCLGTRGYAAPEQFGGHGQTDPRTDIYCLGATMYHLVTGHNPATPPYEMYPIRQWNPALSSGLEEIILKCTQLNPNDRYQNCAELMYALENIAFLEESSKRTQNVRWKLFLASAIMTVVMGLSSTGFFLAQGAQTEQQYQTQIASAKIETNQDVREKHCTKAIELDPNRMEGYIALLETYVSCGNQEYEFNSGSAQMDVFSDDEYEKFKEETFTWLLGSDFKKENVTPEFANNVYYAVGKALLFMQPQQYKDRSSDAQPWLEVAKDKCSGSYKKKAEQLYQFCETNLSIGNKTSGNVRTKKDEWSNWWESYCTIVKTLDQSNKDGESPYMIVCGLISCADKVTGGMTRFMNAGIHEDDVRDFISAVQQIIEDIRKDAEGVEGVLGTKYDQLKGSTMDELIKAFEEAYKVKY